MRKEVLIVLGLFIVVLFLIGGAVWLANAPVTPATQQAHVIVPDDHIPH